MLAFIILSNLTYFLLIPWLSNGWARCSARLAKTFWSNKLRVSGGVGSVPHCSQNEPSIISLISWLITVERNVYATDRLWVIFCKVTTCDVPNVLLIRMKSTSRAVPPKWCSHQFPAGLEILGKFILAWKFDQFEEHIFYNFLILTISSENNYLELIILVCDCLINYILQDMIRNLVILNILIFAKGVPLLFQAG